MKIILPISTDQIAQATAPTKPQGPLVGDTAILATKTALTEDTVNPKFSLRLPPDLALYIRMNFENYNILIRALVQSYRDGRIDRDKVTYEET